MEIEKRVNEKESRRERRQEGWMGGGTERENFTSSRLHSLQTAAEKFVNATTAKRFDKFLSSLFQMSKGQEGSEATRIEEGGNDEGGKGKRRKKKNAKRRH